LAAARERTAILNALRRLEAHGRGNPATGDGKGAEAAHASTLERFEARVPPVPKGTANRAHAALTELAESLRRLEGLAPPALDRDSVRDAFERCYRRSRKAYRKTDRNAGRSFHVLRKRIKDLWYQLEALRPESEEPQTLKPGGPRKYRGRLDTLQDKLGEMQDLAILEARTRNNPEEFGSAGTIREIEAALKAERKRLERKTLRLGAKALDRKAKSVSRKMGLRKAR
jgi:CHAD domain-containing protein